MGDHWNPTPILDSIYEMHAHVRILFITPEAVASISDDNAAILAVLRELGTVDHIVQTDALDYPNFTGYTLCVLGTGSTWTTDNLADIKAVPHLPIFCFDNVTAAYLEMGTATSDATSQTAITVTARIEGSVLGMGSYYKNITGLAAGSNTISSIATYHTITMAAGDLAEVIYATDGTNVVLGFLPSILENGLAGLDETGAELPATLAFFGAGYEAAKLNTLGLAVIYLTCHILIHAQTKPIEIAGTVQNLRKLIIGNMGGQFGSQTPLVEFIAGKDTVGTRLPEAKSLVDLIGNPTAETLNTLTKKWGNISRTLKLILGSRWDASGDLGTDIAQLLTYTDKIDDETVGLTNLKSLIDTIGGIVDDILADTAALETASAKQLFTMDFWSASLEEVSLDGDTAATKTLPTVTVADLPTNATITHAVVMFKFRMIENTHATVANKLDGATVATTSQVIQIDKGTGTYIDAINFVDDQFGIAAATREGGDVIIGSIDVASEVDANDTYELRWLLALADEDLLNFNDVQVGIRIWYSV